MSGAAPNGCRTLHHAGLSFSAIEAGEGPTVLCLHGFPDHARSFRFQMPALARAGFHALAPMMRGYEVGSQPEDGDYHPLRMAEDVVAWIDALGEGPVHLVGHDWGAVVGYLVGAMAPERLLSLTTLAIPHPGRFLRELLPRHPGQLRKSWYIFFFQLRGVAEHVLERRDWAFLEGLWRTWSPGWQLPSEELAAVKATFAQPGVKRAALGYYRATLALASPASREMRRLLASRIAVPTMALTGARDGCVDTRLHDDLMRDEDFSAGLEVIRVEEAGHFLHQEKPDEVNRVLLDWLRASGPRLG